MKKISLKKGQMRAIKAKILKNVFEKNLLLGSHCLHWLQSMVERTLNYVSNDKKRLPDNQNK
jgi:hypothetical protein